MKKNVFLLFIALLSLFVTKANAEAYAIWCEGNTTLYFVSSTNKLSVGKSYDGQRITKVWNGKDVTESDYSPAWNSVIKDAVTRVVFDKSFQEVQVSSTSYWFTGCRDLLSIEGLKNLNTANVTDMFEMFQDCSSLTSLDVSNFNTANVTNMQDMFQDCSSLTSLDVSNFNTANVTNMEDMFWNCRSLASLDVSNFNTANVIRMSGMFANCWSLTSLDVSKFDTSNVLFMDQMFADCWSLTSLDVSNFNTAKVDGMSYMFADCSGLTSLDISNFNTINVQNMGGMFSGCSGLTSLDVSNFNTAKVIKMSWMFHDCSGLTSLDLSNFDTSNVWDMSYMFSFTTFSGLTSLDISNFNTANVEDMSHMFAGCNGLTSLDISKFDTNNVENMSGMFWNCSGLTSLDISNFNTANVEDMSDMFWCCSGLTSLDVSIFNTAKVMDMGYMFSGCSGLTSLDLSKFDTANVTDMSSMFSGCHDLRTIIVGDGWNLNNLKESESMFIGCYKLVGGKGTAYDYDHNDGTYARIDGGPDNPGYLTYYKSPQFYTITYIVDGDVYKTINYEFGATVTPEPIPTKEGYTFSGWSWIPSTMPAENVTVTGTFTQVEYTVDDVTYEITGEGTVTIKGGKQKGEATIGTTVEINGQTYNVTAIAENAFRDNQNITSVTIPEGITTIGDNAFSGCTGLIVINIGKDVQTIGNKAFANVGAASGVRTRSEGNTIVVNCYAETIPQTASDAFENTPIETSTLFVIDDLKDGYKTTSPWSRFGKIIGFEEAAGIKAVMIDFGNTLIFDIQGNRLDNVRKGVNIIRTKDGKTKKMMVK